MLSQFLITDPLHFYSLNSTEYSTNGTGPDNENKIETIRKPINQHPSKLCRFNFLNHVTIIILEAQLTIFHSYVTVTPWILFDHVDVEPLVCGDSWGQGLLRSRVNFQTRHQRPIKVQRGRNTNGHQTSSCSDLTKTFVTSF